MKKQLFGILFVVVLVLFAAVYAYSRTADARPNFRIGGSHQAGAPVAPSSQGDAGQCPYMKGQAGSSSDCPQGSCPMGGAGGANYGQCHGDKSAGTASDGGGCTKGKDKGAQTT